MKKEIKFYVIGGQYESMCYGGCPTLLGAKRLATKCMEYWDNWQGWHKPAIYRAEDTHIVITKGWICYRDGKEIRVPNSDALPIA